MEPRSGWDEKGWRLGRERGQTVVLAAVVLVALVGFLAMAIDLGNVHAQRRRMQNAADAGALAACRLLALGESEATVRDAVGRYALANGAQSWTTTIQPPTVAVTASETFRTFFASIVGVPTFTVSASAAARYEPVGPWRGDLMPLAVYSGALEGRLDGDYVEIWDTEETVVGEGIISDGQRGWLNFDGGAVGDSELVSWITYGWNGEVRPPMWINGTPGAKTSAMKALDSVRLNTTIYVPVYDQVRPGQMGSGQIDYRIVSVAAFKVVVVVDRGNPKYVGGIFLKDVVPQKGGGTIDTGVRVVNLTD